MRSLGLVVAASVGGVAGCSAGAFVCASDEQCGSDGSCEPTGFCSFPDGECDSGRRYGDHAGALASTCVDDEPSATAGVDSSGTASTTTTTTSSTVDTNDPTDGSASTTADPSTTTGPAVTSGGPRCPWAHQRTITVDHEITSETLTAFPIMIEVREVELGAQARPDGIDISFWDPTGTTQRSHEIETFDPEQGWLVAWVRVPQVSADDATQLLMRWGNPQPPPALDPTTVWDADYRGVWHLADVPGGAGSIRDSTAAQEHATPEGAFGPEALVEGAVGLGYILDGIDDSVRVPQSFKGDVSDFTITAWAQISAGQHNPIFWRLNGDFLYPRGDVLASGSYRMQTSIDGGIEIIFSPGAIAPGLHHFVFVGSLSGQQSSQLWLDGALIASEIWSGNAYPTGNFDLAFGVDTDQNGQLEGMLDEVRISAVVRSDAWIRATYRSQAAPETYVTLGPVEPALCD